MSKLQQTREYKHNLTRVRYTNERGDTVHTNALEPARKAFDELEEKQRFPAYVTRNKNRKNRRK